MTRVKFADSDSGSGEYTVVINPTDIKIPWAVNSEIKKSNPVIDGESILFEPYFDTRRGQLIWENIPTDFSYGGSTIQSQISELDDYIGSYKYIDLGDIGSALDVMNGYTKVKIIAQDKILARSGKLIYSKIILHFELAED